MRFSHILLGMLAAVGACAASAVAQTGSAPDSARAHEGFANVTDARLQNAAAEPDQWMTYGGTYGEQRYSKLAQINGSNVQRLGLAWFADYDTNLSQESTPLFIDGVIYVSTAWSKVYAFDARSGRQLWEFDPHVPGQSVVNLCCGVVNRGVAAYQGRIYVGTLDARLIALDARTGKPVWSVQTTPPGQPYSITGAPRIAKGRVVIGNGGADYGARGYISAYDAETGKLDWRFFVVPGNPALGPDGAASDSVMPKVLKTWTGDAWWKTGAGGGPWDSIVYDPEADLLYFGTGNGGPWNARIRSPDGGDNLFLSSIVALRPETGQYVWHYIETPSESWDYDATQPLMVTNIKLDGAERRVVMHAPKNGFFYILDARTGKLLRATAYTKINWADGVDMKTGRPRVNPQARYQVGKPFTMLPGSQGAHSWNPMAYSPQTGLVYIPVQRAYFRFVADPHYVIRHPGANLGVDLTQLSHVNDFVGYLEAWDPIAGKIVWTQSENPGQPGGALATAGGLVFQGGGANQEFRAYDAQTGEKLWSTQAQTSIFAGPVSYELDGKQYVAVSVGGSEAGGYYDPNHSRLMVYVLDGNAPQPVRIKYTPRPLDPPPATASADVVQAGREQYSHYCQECHGNNGHTRRADFPDLARTPLLYSQAGFDAVVLKGVLTSGGMVSFAQVLKPADTSAIRAFIIARANDLKKAGSAGN